MLAYKFYYWEVPFRGNFIQLLLEEVGATYERHDATEIFPDKSLSIRHPGMAPPYLYDCKTNLYLAQMPAILMYLGNQYGYLPKRPETLALALKTLLDCNDVLVEITNSNGMQMWTKKSWNAFRADRLPRWMTLFEQTGLAHGLQRDQGFLLGSTPPISQRCVNESKPGPLSALSLNGNDRTMETCIAAGRLNARCEK